MFEKKRDKITVFTDIKMAKFFIYIYIILAITKNKSFLNKKELFKKRILYSLFKKRKVRLKNNRLKPIFYTSYTKMVEFVLKEKARFYYYCK